MDKNSRWFAPVNYNMVRVANRLSELIEEKGGEVERHSDELVVHTRGYTRDLMDAKEHLETAANVYLSMSKKEDSEKMLEKGRQAMRKLLDEIDELKKKDEAAPVIRTRFCSLGADIWMRFELDGWNYYWQTEDNPFFPDGLIKKPQGSKAKYYLDEIDGRDKTWMFDDLFQPVAKEETIEKAARNLFTSLTKHQPSELYS